MESEHVWGRGNERLAFTRMYFVGAERCGPPWDYLREYLLADLAFGIDVVVFKRGMWRRNWSVKRKLRVASSDDTTSIMRELYGNVAVVLRVNRRSAALATLLGRYEAADDGFVRGPADEACFERPLPWPRDMALQNATEAFVVVYHDADQLVLLESPASEPQA